MQSRVNGQIMGVYFRQGDEVKKQDQPLLLIDSLADQAALDQARAACARSGGAGRGRDGSRPLSTARRAKLDCHPQTEQDQVYVVGQDQGTVQG